MRQTTAAIIFALLILLSAQQALGANTYENLSINYGYSVTEHVNAATPESKESLFFFNYVLSDDVWTSQIRLSYLPEQNTQENPALTVRQESFAASVAVLAKFELTKNSYFGPRFNYAYQETEGTMTTISGTSDLQSHADSLSGQLAIGYSLNKKSDIIFNYTYRDDFLTTNQNNSRPVGLELLYTLKNNSSLHLGLGTHTEKPDAVDNAYSVTIGYGTTF